MNELWATFFVIAGEDEETDQNENDAKMKDTPSSHV